MTTQRRTLQETRTAMPPAEVLQDAKEFFARRVTIYSAYIEQESAKHVTLRGQGGEEITISAIEHGGATLVTGASYIFDGQIGRFFSTLPPAPAAAPETVTAEATA